MSLSPGIEMSLLFTLYMFQRSRLASHHTEDARDALLQFFDADPDIYSVVWTANTSSAMRIVGEGYSWHSGSRIFVGLDSHSLCFDIIHTPRALWL